MSVLTRPGRNWKSFLTAEDAKHMTRLLDTTAKHKPAYLSADDVRIAQLWCALLEAQKEKAVLEQRIARLEYLLGGLTGRARRLERARTELLDSLGRF